MTDDSNSEDQGIQMPYGLGNEIAQPMELPPVCENKIEVWKDYDRDKWYVRHTGANYWYTGNSRRGVLLTLDRVEEKIHEMGMLQREAFESQLPVRPHLPFHIGEEVTGPCISTITMKDSGAIIFDQPFGSGPLAMITHEKDGKIESEVPVSGVEQGWIYRTEQGDIFRCGPYAPGRYRLIKPDAQ